MSDTKPKPYRILSLDGGGVRGIITARWLARLEEHLGGRIRKHIDLVVGTSTGSILACAVASGIPAEEITKMYRERSRMIFPKRSSWNVFGKAWDWASNVAKDGISHPKYQPEGLQAEMKRVFKTSTLKQLKLPTMVTSYNTLSRQAVMFKSWDPKHATHKVWEVCTASASAPTYFPAHVMKIGGVVKVPLVDGGVVANNPTACAIAEAVRLQTKKSIHVPDVLGNIIVVSLGTGETTRPITIEEAQEWGALEWAIPIIDVLFDGAADSVSYIAKHLIGEGRYHRLQVPLSEAYDEMDNADATNLNALSVVADSYLQSGGDAKLKAIAKQLIRAGAKKKAKKTKAKAKKKARTAAG